MKGFIATTTTTIAFLCLTLFILALANDHELRAPDGAVHSEEGNEENHRSLQVTVTKDSVDPKLGTELTQLFQDYLHVRNLDASNASPVEYVSVDIAFKSVLDNKRAKEVLRPAFAVNFISCFKFMCSTRVPVSALKDISNIDAVQVVHSVKAVIDVVAVTTKRDRALAEGGSVISEGVKAMYADVARTTYGVNGTGLLIGVLSDSYNCKGGADADIASGDLPSGANSIVILSDLNTTECGPAVDVGRAMMQLIHDVAPGARLAFHTSYRGQADFANGILLLASAGCDILVGGTKFYAEPMFQDGIIAEAVNQVVAQGIIYIANAGGNARSSWDATSGFIPVTTITGRVLHQFGTNARGNPITRMSVTVPGDNLVSVFVIQWNDPFKSSTGTVGAQSDLDIIVYLNNVQIYEANSRNIVGGDPFELFQSFASAEPITYEIEILKFAGPSPSYIKCVVSGGDVTFQFPTNLGTIYGYANTASAAGVGAAEYLKTPAYGVTPPKIEAFSSVGGGTPIFLAPNGTRLASPEIRNQPRFIGPDNVANTFLGTQDGNGIWRILGTSPAAAHIAAVAALMLQWNGGPRSLTPAQIYSTLQATAVDMDDPFTPGFDNGFDFGTGYGLVNAQAALQALASPTTPVTAPIVAPVTSPVVDCTITFALFNALTNRLVVTLTNGTDVANPPLCGWANIEVLLPCGDLDDLVTLELYQGTNRIHATIDSGVPYFLFGNRGSNVKRGKIPAGSYGIRAQVDGIWSPWTNFTLGGSCN